MVGLLCEVIESNLVFTPILAYFSVIFTYFSFFLIILLF